MEIKKKYTVSVSLSDLNLSISKDEEQIICHVITEFNKYGIGSSIFMENSILSDLLSVHVNKKTYRPFDSIVEDIICKAMGKDKFKKYLTKNNISYLDDDDVMDFLMAKKPIDLLYLVLDRNASKIQK